MLLPGGSKAGSLSNKHKNSLQAGKQLAAVAQAAQKRSFLTERKQNAQASPSTGAASTLAATIAAAIISPAAANPLIQPPVVPQLVDPSPSTSLPQRQTAVANNVADSKGQTEGAIQQNNASTQPETKEGRHAHLPGDSLASNPKMPPFLSGSTSLEDKRTQQYASSSTASEAQAQNREQPYASTSSERQAQHPSQSYASTSGKSREQAPTLLEVPPMRSDPSNLSQFPDAVNISVQHLPSSLHFPTCSVEVPPQDFGEIPTSWEEYASRQPHSSSDLESSHNALLAHLEFPASFPPLLDTEPPSLTLDQTIPSSVNVSLGQMPSFTQSNPNPMFDLSQFLDTLPAAPLAQQHPHSTSASKPPFSSQAKSSSRSDDLQSLSSTPNQDVPSAMWVGSDGHCAMDCDDDIILKSNGSGGDTVMDIDDQGPLYEPIFHHPSEVREPSYTTPTTSIETPAQTYDSPPAQLPNFIPASYQPPTQPLPQTPTFVQDPPYNRSTFWRDAPRCEPTFMQETPLCRTVPELPKTSGIMDRCNSWLLQAVVSPCDSGIPYTPRAFPSPPSARSTLPPAPNQSTCWPQAPKARAQPLRDSTNRTAMIGSLRATRFIKDIRQSASEQPRWSKWVEINQDYEIQEPQKGRYYGSSMQPSFQEEPASSDSFGASGLSHSKLERDIRPLPSHSHPEGPMKFYPIAEYNTLLTTPQPALRYHSGVVYNSTPVSSVFLDRSGQRRKRDDKDSFEEDAEGLENVRDHSKRFKASHGSDTQHARPQKRPMPGHFPLDSATSGQPDRKTSWRRSITKNCGFCDAIPVVGAFLRFLGMP
ncbi:hypothetical protein K443DRAFT_107677 [Laccaria amethystina LaAM-08-1]|uniref:Uncharacterized protein n=1 Tax=Laccaria amethystina LaAM-08-1 TaxID=1095629 RepID=A0A0C9XEN8_9AGAR|nr:hypothetical protein K443DRAFT_107677 [Laccaria amethystina LaAM-08-1]